MTVRVAVLVCAASTFLCNEAEAQRRLRGLVTDDQTRLPVGTAAVALLDADGRRLSSTVSDAQGNFELQIPAAGKFRVRAERIGYFPRESITLNLAGGSAGIVELVLWPHPVLLDSMMVRARSESRELRVTEQLIHGRLLDDESGAPIDAATLVLTDERGRRVLSTVTDRFGLFRLVTPGPGVYRLRGERIGYRSAEQGDLRTRLGDTLRVDFRLSAQAVLLAPMVVMGSSKELALRNLRPDLKDVYSRMTRFGGKRFAQYIVRDTIDSYEKRSFTMSRLLDYKIVGSSTRGRDCANEGVYMDGVPFPDSLDAYSLSIFEIVEVYIHPTIPAELSLPTTGNPAQWRGVPPCRVVLLWTRR